MVDDQSSFPFDINTDLLIPFAVVVAVCFITMTSFLVSNGRIALRDIRARYCNSFAVVIADM